MALERRTLALVTGASRGLGRQVALQLAGRLAAGSVLVVTARSGALLDTLAQQVAAVAPAVRVCRRTCDLATADGAQLAQLVSAGLDCLDADDSLQSAMVVHNAGDVGDVSLTVLQQADVADVTAYMRFNVASCLALNSAFVRLVRPRVPAGCVTVVNVSSLCALQPFKSMGLYCAAKAARDMLFRVLAAEEPALRVLSYAPGPLVTDMSRKVAASAGDADLRSMFKDGIQGAFLTCDVTVTRLLGILDADKFETGSHIDYYDQDASA